MYVPWTRASVHVPRFSTKSFHPLHPCWGRQSYVPAARRRTLWGLPIRCRFVRSVLTSGPNRKLQLGELTVDLRHAPRWQLVAPHQPAGDAVRALAWVGPGKVDEALSTIQKRLPQKDLEELVDCRATMPAWMAEPVSALIAYR